MNRISSILCQTRAKSESLPSSFSSIQNISNSYYHDPAIFRSLSRKGHPIATNKQLLISESHGDSNRCTPYRGKLDQHDTYASHVSPHTPCVCFLRAVLVCGNLSQAINSIGRTLLLLRQRAPDTTPSSAE
jgi:hypothetical protein